MASSSRVVEPPAAEGGRLESDRGPRFTLNALTVPIVVLDENGIIIGVNSAWAQFDNADDHPGGRHGVGDRYLLPFEPVDSGGSPSREGSAFTRGFHAVMAGENNGFTLEYPCHQPGEPRWLLLRVTRFGGDGPGRVVITHEDITARKRTEEELQWKTAFLEALVNSSLDGMLVVDQQGKKVLQNQRLTDFFQIPPHIADDPDDQKQVRWVTGMTKDPERFIVQVRRLYAQPSATSRDEIEMKDGRVLDRYTAPVLGKEGEHYGRIWMFRDVTEQRRAEASLRMQAHTLDHVGRAVIAADTGGRIIYVNRFAEELYGWPAAEMLGQNVVEATIPHATHEEAEQILTQLRQGENWSGEILVRHRDGRKFPAFITSTPLRDHHGAVIGVIGISEDITERHLAAEELSRSRETLRGILDNIPQRVFWKDRNSVYLGCNRPFAVDEGFNEPGKLVGKTDYEIYSRPVAERCRGDDRIVMEADAAKTGYEEPGTTAEGRPAWLRTNKIPLHDSQGQVVGILGTYEDITEHKLAKLEIERLNADLERRVAQRTEALSAATQEAERANRAKSEFLSRTSHELRTPMNAILGFGQLLEMEEDLGPQTRECVEQILGAGRHLLNLIDEVLDISNAESGRLTLSLEPVAVEPLIEKTLGLVRPLGATLQIEVSRAPTTPPGHQHVLADPQRLRQVLLNLLANAIKYNRLGGSVTVDCVYGERVEPPRIRLCVKDTGPGISADNLTRLFTPFDRLDAERTQTHIAGTGLGLALAKRMVELMGGSLGVESVVGEGSTFWVELPAIWMPSD